MIPKQNLVANRFAEVVKNRHDYAKEWKARTGGKVIGYFCTYVPEEIIYSAGMLPVRLLGRHEPQDVTERHIAGMYCPFCRDVLAQGLQGRYEYLDGIVMANSCIHLRQAFESWRLHVPTPFVHFVYMPCKLSAESARDVLIAELRKFRTAIENWIGRKILPTAIDNAIDAYNANRRLLRQAYELRKADNPPLSGAQAMEMVLASQLMDKAEHSKVLSCSLKELSQGEAPSNGGHRLMVVGSEDDDSQIMHVIESLGANIVIDETCTGSRYFWNETFQAGDALASLSRRYLERPPCPAKDISFVGRRRFKHILELAQEYRVDGVIILQQKFCHPHEFDYPELVQILQKNNLPSLLLEIDLTIPYGQFRTRVEAFLEMLG